MSKIIEKISLGLDSKNYEAAVKIDRRLFEQIEVLNAIIVKSIGDDVVDSYDSLLDNPITYLSDLYWNKYSKHYPNISDKKQTYLRASGISAGQILATVESIKSSIKALRNHKPIIDGGTIKSGVSEENFTLFVHKNKVESYKLIQSVLRNHKKLKELYPFSQDFQLMRQYQPMIEMRGLMLRPNRNYFKQ